MANGAPSPDGFKPPADPEVTIDLQEPSGPPQSAIVEEFGTYQAHFQSMEEIRDDNDKVVREAHVEVTHTVTIQIGPLGLILKQYKTRYSPLFAQQCAEGLATATQEALDSMKEKPLDTSALEAKGMTIATSMSDVEKAAQAAQAAEDELRGRP